jgi:TonB C terminal
MPDEVKPDGGSLLGRLAKRGHEMTTPSPELRNLYLRVIRRVHPDGAIDEQDRLRCEHLTQEANHAYAVGDEAALRAVLEPKPPRPGWNPRRLTRRPFVLAWKALIRKPWQMAGAAIAFVVVCGYIIIAVRPSKTAHVVQQQAGVQQPPENPEARIANIPAPDIRAGEPSRQSATAHGNKNLGRPSPSHNHAGLTRYLEAVKTQVENNFDQHSLDAPGGTSAEIAVVIRGDGQPGEPHLMMTSGYSAVDSACLLSVEQIPTFGSTPTDESMTVNFQCTVRAR